MKGKKFSIWVILTVLCVMLCTACSDAGNDLGKEDTGENAWPSRLVEQVNP